MPEPDTNNRSRNVLPNYQFQPIGLVLQPTSSPVPDQYVLRKPPYPISTRGYLTNEPSERSETLPGDTANYQKLDRYCRIIAENMTCHSAVMAVLLRMSRKDRKGN